MCCVRGFACGGNVCSAAFREARAFNANISAWDVSSVKGMFRREWMGWLVGFDFEEIWERRVCMCVWGEGLDWGKEGESMIL